MKLGLCCCLTFSLVFTLPEVAAEKMTLAEARARIPDRRLPEFWCGDVKGLEARWEKLETGRATAIAISPGGRALHMISYGEREPVTSNANFNSAIGGGESSAYMNKKARHKPVVLFVGPVHGQEVEGLSGLVNLIQIMETGSDLRGIPRLQLRALGRKCRLLILPAGNPDGVARFEPRMLQGMEELDLRFWGQGSWKDGTVGDWPQVKRVHPMVGDRVGFLGCYFNDAGINPMHDEFFALMSSETAAILRLAREEGPDMAVSLHSHESRPAILRPAYVPMEVQLETRQLAGRLYARLAKLGLPHATPFEAESEHGNPPESFNLVSALYHVSGTLAFTFECPHGLRGDHACPATPAQILDIQLALYECMLEQALERK